MSKSHILRYKVEAPFGVNYIQKSNILGFRMTCYGFGYCNTIKSAMKLARKLGIGSIICRIYKTRSGIIKSRKWEYIGENNGK